MVMLIVSEKEIDAVATQGRTGFRIEKVPGVGLQGKSPGALLKFALRFRAGLAQCHRLYADFQPAAVRQPTPAFDANHNCPNESKATPRTLVAAQSRPPESNGRIGSHPAPAC